MNYKRSQFSIMNESMSDINDKRPFPLHEQSWYRKDLLKITTRCSVYDVGGQRGQRRKWLQMFDSITAIIFVLDCSCYDLSLREDDTKNRMLEACHLFHQLWNNRYSLITSFRGIAGKGCVILKRYGEVMSILCLRYA